MGRLGYDSYFAQGGDWGALVTSWVARHDKNCKGIHLNMVVVPQTLMPQILLISKKRPLKGGSTIKIGILVIPNNKALGHRVSVMG